MKQDLLNKILECSPGTRLYMEQNYGLADFTALRERSLDEIYTSAAISLKQDLRDLGLMYICDTGSYLDGEHVECMIAARTVLSKANISKSRVNPEFDALLRGTVEEEDYDNTLITEFLERASGMFPLSKHWRLLDEYKFQFENSDEFVGHLRALLAYEVPLSDVHDELLIKYTLNLATHKEAVLRARIALVSSIDDEVDNLPLLESYDDGLGAIDITRYADEIKPGKYLFGNPDLISDEKVVYHLTHEPHHIEYWQRLSKSEPSITEIQLMAMEYFMYPEMVERVTSILKDGAYSNTLVEMFEQLTTKLKGELNGWISGLHSD